MKNLPVLILLLCLGCVRTDYAPFVGGQPVFGTGGTCLNFQGMEIWNDGTPPRQYRVIGIIDDTRRRSLIAMAGYPGDLVNKAKAVVRAVERARGN